MILVMIDDFDNASSAATVKTQIEDTCALK